MAAKTVKDRQNFLHYYKEQTGKTEVDMKEVARLAKKMGWPLPELPDPLDLLAKKFADAAREEVRYDKKTRRPYRANLSIVKRRTDGSQLSLWIDTDEADRGNMHKALTLYREQMVGEAVIATNTADHWNNIHPDQQPLKFETDLTPDKDWRLNAPDDDEKAS